MFSTVKDMQKEVKKELDSHEKLLFNCINPV